MKKLILLLMTLLVMSNSVQAASASSQEATQSKAPELHILASDEMERLLSPLSQSFENEHQVSLVFETASPLSVFSDSPGISHADLLLGFSAKSWINLLNQQLVLANSQTVIAHGQLSYWNPTSRHPNRRTLSQTSVLAVPSTQEDPYASAAEDLLKRYGMQPFKGRLFQPFTALGTYQLIQTGHVEGGITSTALLRSHATDPRQYWRIPPELYPPIAIYGAITTQAAQPALATRYLSWLTSAPIQEHLQKAGNLLP
ncbi:molybdate ABC transporter substrate-binding protein [Pokkaliibacter sp. CJK22405]|uniref:molybdate ABC transporter substrate-binding protein n=1 Tax=Pokkaliibacter sp. CJK22405 TaxID=3384615 RepID=UPI003984DB46